MPNIIESKHGVTASANNQAATSAKHGRGRSHQNLKNPLIRAQTLGLTFPKVSCT